MFSFDIQFITESHSYKKFVNKKIYIGLASGMKEGKCDSDNLKLYSNIHIDLGGE